MSQVLDFLIKDGFEFKGKTALIWEDQEEELWRELRQRGVLVVSADRYSDKFVVSGILQDCDLVVLFGDMTGWFCRNQCMDALVIDCGREVFEEKPWLTGREVIRFYE